MRNRECVVGEVPFRYLFVATEVSLLLINTDECVAFIVNVIIFKEGSSLAEIYIHTKQDFLLCKFSLIKSCLNFLLCCISNLQHHLPEFTKRLLKVLLIRLSDISRNRSNICNEFKKYNNDFPTHTYCSYLRGDRFAMPLHHKKFHSLVSKHSFSVFFSWRCLSNIAMRRKSHPSVKTKCNLRLSIH